MKQVGLLMLYSMLGVLACVGWFGLGVFASQCWRVLYVHPCIVVEKRKVNIIYLLLSA